MKTLFALLLFSISSINLAGESFIPLQKGVRIASDDLIYEDNVLSSREAQDLSDNQNIDLALLDPKSNAIWSFEKSLINDQEAVAVDDGDSFAFEGSLTSNTGLYRFNAVSQKGSKVYTVHLDKTLHTLLLRKNILRQLGYKIPAIKYLKKITVEFKTIEERDQFLKKDIPENTLGTADRWVKNINELTLDLYDIAVTEPSENDFYNVAMGVPTQTINSRTLRSLIIPYSVLDLYESVNKFSWVDGKIDNRAAILSHFTGNDFATTLEDARWMIKRFSRLTREDIKEAVEQAFFPSEVGSVVIEKIISRRNSLNKLFSENILDIPANQKITIGESVKDGKIIQKDYSGYASRFAHGDAESPFEQLRFYLYAKLQSSAIDNLVLSFNKNLSAYDLGEARSKFFQKQFEDGLSHYLETGEIKPIGIETWFSPIVNAQLIFSRDVVLGNYLGTDNLVQLADTFGASVNLGVYLGVEGLGLDLAGSAKASVAIVRTFSHLKPVKNLRQSLKEPYKNMFVNLLKNSLKERYFSLSELKNSTESNDEKAKKVQILLKEINQYLDTGESLIMTDRLMPSAEVKLNFTNGLLSAGLGVGGGVTTIKRIHIYKKSPKVLQIYDDSGFVTDINMSFQVSKFITFLKITGKFNKGNYNLKSYMVNLSSDLEENPNLYSNALGVYNVLQNKDFEILNSLITPVKVKAKFKDRSFGFSLLAWKIKSIRGKTYYDVEAKDGVNGTYFSLNKDYMNGVNVESLSKQVANYYLAEPSKGNASLVVDGDINPGDTFFGRSHTKSIHFEASLNTEKKFERKFLSLSDSREGWAMSPKKLKKMMIEVNEKFQATLFNIAQIDFEKLRLFKVGYHLNLYDKGIERLNNIKVAEIRVIEDRYKKERNCDMYDKADPSNYACGNLDVLVRDVEKCQRNRDDDEDLASCNVTLIEDLLDNLLFADFIKILGLNNIYVYGTIDGFRQKSEILNDTIFSNTLGKIGSKQWNGSLDVVRDLLGLSGGEFFGTWLRDNI